MARKKENEGERSLRRSLIRIVPPKWRRLRSEILLALKRHESHYERIERRDFFRRAFRALAFNGIDGDYAEFGCCGGQTFGLAYLMSRRAGLDTRLWAFDSFQGLPSQEGPKDEHPVWIEGDMSISLEDFGRVCRSYGMKAEDYEVTAGFYDQTLEDTDIGRTDVPRDIALAYIDCDLYSSTVAVLNFLLPRLRHGMIVAFDDYYCWSSTALSGERSACDEFFRDHSTFSLAPYLQFGWHGMSFIVEHRALLKTGST